MVPNDQAPIPWLPLSGTARAPIRAGGCRGHHPRCAHLVCAGSPVSTRASATRSPRGISSTASHGGYVKVAVGFRLVIGAMSFSPRFK